MAKVKYHMCVDNVIRTEKEVQDTSIIDYTLIVDTDFTHHLKEKEIKDNIFNYLYNETIQPIWLIDNRKNNCIWKGRK